MVSYVHIWGRRWCDFNFLLVVFFCLTIFCLVSWQLGAAAVAPRQRCSDLSRFPENLAWKLLPKEKLM